MGSDSCRGPIGSGGQHLGNCSAGSRAPWLVAALAQLGVVGRLHGSFSCLLEFTGVSVPFAAFVAHGGPVDSALPARRRHRPGAGAHLEWRVGTHSPPRAFGHPRRVFRLSEHRASLDRLWARVDVQFLCQGLSPRTGAHRKER